VNFINIYVDLDDVNAESTRSYVDIVRNLFGRTVDYENINTFDLKISFGFTQDEFNHFFHVVHQPEAILSFKPLEGAIQVLAEWASNGAEIRIVTGRLASSYDASMEWLVANGVPFHSLSMVDKYSRPENRDSNAMSLTQLSEMRFQLAIEDSPAMAEFLSRQMGIPVLLLNRPWNRGATLANSVQRCRNWRHIRRVAGLLVPRLKGQPEKGSNVLTSVQ